MPLEITYWTGHAPTNNNFMGRPISSESVTLGSDSAATPINAALVSLYATEAVRFDYSSDASSASTTTSAYMGIGERIIVQAIPGYIIDTATPA